MQHKTIIKLVSALMLASVVVVALARVRPPQTQEQQNSRLPDSTSGTSIPAEQLKNPMPPEVAKEFNDQNRRSYEAEQQARQLLKERHFEDAQKACYRALELSPKFNGQTSNMTAIQLLGDISQEQGHYQEAIDAYSKALRHSVGPKSDLNIALCYLKLGDLTNARKFFNEKSFFGSKVELPPAKMATYMAQLPGTKTAKTMEASILFARGCEKESVAQRDEAVEDFKKVLALVPHNALAARSIAWDLGSLDRGKEATQYWARAAVFGTGDTAHEARIELKNVLMPDKVEQALAQARKIAG